MILNESIRYNLSLIGFICELSRNLNETKRLINPIFYNDFVDDITLSSNLYNINKINNLQINNLIDIITRITTMILKQ